MYKYTFLSYGKLSDLLSINNKSDLRNEQSQYIEKYIPSAYDSLHRPYFSRFICIHFPRASCDERRIFDFVIYGESPTSTTRHAHFAPKIGPTGVCCLQATYAATTTPTTIDNHRQQKAAAILCLSCIHFFFVIMYSMKVSLPGSYYCRTAVILLTVRVCPLFHQIRL